MDAHLLGHTRVHPDIQHFAGYAIFIHWIAIENFYFVGDALDVNDVGGFQILLFTCGVRCTFFGT